MVRYVCQRMALLNPDWLTNSSVGFSCLCDNFLAVEPLSNVAVNQTACNLRCVGDLSELCGANNVLQLYVNAPSIKPAVNGYSYIGCYKDTASAHPLVANSITNASMTLESCQTFCTGYNYFGTENGMILSYT